MKNFCGGNHFRDNSHMRIHSRVRECVGNRTHQVHIQTEMERKHSQQMVSILGSYLASLELPINFSLAICSGLSYADQRGRPNLAICFTFENPGSISSQIRLFPMGP